MADQIDYNNLNCFNKIFLDGATSYGDGITLDDFGFEEFDIPSSLLQGMKIVDIKYCKYAEDVPTTEDGSYGAAEILLVSPTHRLYKLEFYPDTKHSRHLICKINEAFWGDSK